MDIGLLLHGLNRALDSPVGLLVLAAGLLLLHMPAGFLSGILRWGEIDVEELGGLTLVVVLAYIFTAAAFACLFFGLYIPALAALKRVGLIEIDSVPLQPFLAVCLLAHVAAQGSFHVVAFRRNRMKQDAL